MMRETVKEEETFLDVMFPALASPIRRRLLQLLLDGPKSVNSLAEHFDRARPSVSEHLKVLLTAGMVTERRVGRERHYSLSPMPIREMADWMRPYEAYWRERTQLMRAALDEEEAGR
jgi:DNA-binding transcriptional ArsR family regulator